MSQQIGKCRYLLIQTDGETSEIVAKYIPDIWSNILSLNKAIENPNIKLSCSKGIISLNMGRNVIHFDKALQNGIGGLLGAETLKILKILLQSPIILLWTLIYSILCLVFPC
jgi:hypothetical protein